MIYSEVDGGLCLNVIEIAICSDIIEAGVYGFNEILSPDLELLFIIHSNYQGYSSTRNIVLLVYFFEFRCVTDNVLCCSGTGGDRFSRILKHMLTQRR